MSINVSHKNDEGRYYEVLFVLALVLFSGYFTLYGMWWPEETPQYYAGWIGSTLFTVIWLSITSVDDEEEEIYEETPGAVIAGPIIFCWLMMVCFGSTAVGWFYWKFLHIGFFALLAFSGLLLWAAITNPREAARVMKGSIIATQV